MNEQLWSGTPDRTIGVTSRSHRVRVRWLSRLAWGAVAAAALCDAWGLLSGNSQLSDLLLLCTIPLAAGTVLLFEYQRAERLHFGGAVCTAAGLHAILGYFLAIPALIVFPDLERGIADSFHSAFAIICLGVFTTCLTYSLGCGPVVVNKAPEGWLVKGGAPVAGRRAIRLVLMSSVAIWALLAYVGIVPILSANPLTARFVPAAVSPVAAALLNKCLAIVGVCAPVVLLASKKLRRWPVFLLGLASVAATGNRDWTFFMLCAGPAAWLIFRKKTFLYLLWMVPIAFAFFFLGDALLKFDNQLGDDQLLSVFANTSAEPAAFGYALTKWDGRFYYGRSYLAGFLPLPVALSGFKAQYGLQGITREMTNDAFGPGAVGGLRITGYGEAYLNFGVFGVILFGCFLGRLLLVVGRFLSRCAEVSPLHIYGCLVIGVAPFLFLYVSGSMGIWDTLLAPILIVAFLFAKTERSRSRSLRMNPASVRSAATSSGLSV